MDLEVPAVWEILSSDNAVQDLNTTHHHAAQTCSSRIHTGSLIGADYLIRMARETWLEPMSLQHPLKRPVSRGLLDIVHCPPTTPQT